MPTDITNTEAGPLVAVVGPTAIGKTALAMHLAGQFPAEIISADSRQVYKYLDIGTAKPTLEEQARVTHHVIDIVTPDRTFSVMDFQCHAEAALRDIWSRRKMALLVGGSGYYVRAVLERLRFPRVEISEDVRETVRQLVDERGLPNAVAEIRAVDPRTADRIDGFNRRRVLRALEIVRATGKPLPSASSNPRESLVLGLSMDRQALYRRADERVEGQVQAGLIEETREVVAHGFSSDLEVLRGLAYGQMLGYIEGRRTRPEAIQDYKYATHSLIRRQMTWFRKETRVHWLDVGDRTMFEDAAVRVRNFLAAQQGIQEMGEQQ